MHTIYTTNPITNLDYPDPDVIRVGNTYYMVSTTMHFMPGCVILRSFDLIHWEIESYVYETLDDTPAQKLEEGNIYGKGMWAATIRYHKGTFYICFVANDTHKTYLYRASSIKGPWTKTNIEGFYHDCSLLFEENRTFIVYGNKEIWLTELNEALTAPKPGGLHRRIVYDEGNSNLGYEGAHLYKINEKYYVFFIHSLKTQWRRVEACFVSDSLEGEFIGGDVLNDDMGYCGQGVAQGGIVDTPDGNWYAILFQDRGAVGRIPVLVPVHFINDFPVFGENGKIPEKVEVPACDTSHDYEPLYGSDDFSGKLKNFWQWNHNPDNSMWTLESEPSALCLTNGKICQNVEQAVNTLTQRMLDPGCSGTVTIDGTQMKNGDIAGLCAFQACYAYLAITKENDCYYLIMTEKTSTDASAQEEVKAKIELSSPIVTLRLDADFENMKDTCQFFYKKNQAWIPLGPSHQMYFKLDHFTGNRFALFSYATKETGGKVRFTHFVYE